MLNHMSSQFYGGADDRNRTGTVVSNREILSLLRLPVSPRPHFILCTGFTLSDSCPISISQVLNSYFSILHVKF